MLLCTNGIAISIDGNLPAKLTASGMPEALSFREDLFLGSSVNKSQLVP
jgi:hypothetical protein